MLWFLSFMFGSLLLGLMLRRRRTWVLASAILAYSFVSAVAYFAFNQI